jgi:hypothetical protein
MMRKKPSGSAILSSSKVAAGESSSQYRFIVACWLLRMTALRPKWRLINAFWKFRQRILQQKMLKKYDRSQYVYENKQISDKMT